MLLCYNGIAEAKAVSGGGLGRRGGIVEGGTLAKITKYLSISRKWQRKASSSNTLFVPPNY